MAIWDSIIKSCKFFVRRVNQDSVSLLLRYCSKSDSTNSEPFWSRSLWRCGWYRRQYMAHAVTAFPGIEFSQDSSRSKNRTCTKIEHGTSLLQTLCKKSNPKCKIRFYFSHRFWRREVPCSILCMFDFSTCWDCWNCYFKQKLWKTPIAPKKWKFRILGIGGVVFFLTNSILPSTTSETEVGYFSGWLLEQWKERIPWLVAFPRVH